jgi:hypothetical protein
MEVPEQGKVKAAGGQYRKLAGKDAIALWTLTKGLSVCEPTATGSRRLLKLQLDYWLLKPLSAGQMQLIHLQVDTVRAIHLVRPGHWKNLSSRHQ